jgi:protein phosphatase
MTFFAKTDQGKKRRMNQDYVFASGEPVGILPNLYLLADGMGGHRAGDYASRTTVESLRKYYEKAKEGPLPKLMEEGIHKVNEEIYRESISTEALHGMGTTLVIAVMEENCLTVANIGDSRAYLIRGNVIRQITRDHSYVEEMASRGLMRRGSREYMEQRNIITRAVGIEKTVEADFFEVEIEEGDYVLMCSDGLSNMVDNESIRNIIRDSSTIPEKGQALIDAANINGGRDNIAVILIDPFRKEVLV